MLEPSAKVDQAIANDHGTSDQIEKRASSLKDRFIALAARLQDLEVGGTSRADGLGGRASQVQGVGQQVDNAGAKATLAKELLERGVEASFIRVPDDYYDKDLEYRRECLQATSIQHLCKSIVMENTKAPPDFHECGTFEDSRYFCVIVQYSARLHADKLKRYLHKLNGKLGIKYFNMRLAPADVSDRLTGFTHNAVR